MTKKQHIVWALYYLVVTVFTLKSVIYFFNPHSDVYFYFQILQYFDPLFLTNYSFALIEVILGVLMLIPLALFICQERMFDPFVWQVFFVLKIIFDIVGHPFELNYLVSIYRSNPLLCLAIFLYGVSVYIPAYTAVFIYSFRQKSLNLKPF